MCFANSTTSICRVRVSQMDRLATSTRYLEQIYRHHKPHPLLSSPPAAAGRDSLHLRAHSPSSFINLLSILLYNITLRTDPFTSLRSKKKKKKTINNNTMLCPMHHHHHHQPSPTTTTLSTLCGVKKKRKIIIKMQHPSTTLPFISAGMKLTYHTGTVCDLPLPCVNPFMYDAPPDFTPDWRRVHLVHVGPGKVRF